MADDEKTLRIIATTDEGKKVSEKPAPPKSAGEVISEQEQTKSESTPTVGQEQLAEQVKEREVLEELLDSIRHRSEEPLFQAPPEGPQGWTSTEPPSPAAPGSGEGLGAEAVKSESSGAGIGAEAATPAAGGSGAGSGIPPVSTSTGAPLPPPPPPAPLGAVPAVGSTAGTAGANAAASGLAEAFVGLAADIGLVGAALVGAQSAITGFAALLLSGAELIIKQWEDISPQIAQARAQQDIELTLKKIQTEPEVGEVSADLIAEETDFYKELLDLGRNILTTFGPGLELLIDLVNSGLAVTNLILEVLKLAETPANFVRKETVKFMKWVRDRLEGQPLDPINDFQKEVSDLFSGKDLFKTLPRIDLPEPHANQPPTLRL